MANAALLNGLQFLGPTFSGYLVYSYEAGGTTTAKALYKSSSGSSGASHAQGFALNANGSTTNGIWGEGFYRILIKDPTATTTILDWDNVSGGDATAATADSGTTLLNPSANLLTNSEFTIWENDTTTLTGKADATKVASGWYGLTQSGNFDATLLSSTGDTAATYALRMTNTHASSQRMGVVQASDLQLGARTVGNTVFGQCRVRTDSNMTVRCGLLAWEATTTPTIDPVGTWTSPTFTEGNFYATNASWEVIASSSASVTASTWTDVSVSGTVPNNCTSLIFVVWTDSTVSVNGTFDVSNAAVYENSTALSFRSSRQGSDKAAAVTKYIKPVDATTTVDFGTGNTIGFGSSNTITGGSGSTITLPSSNTIAKWFVQEVYTNVTSSTTGTTAVPADDTIPQNTEGDEYMTLAITPKNATNKLRIQAKGTFAQSTAGSAIVMALFQDTTANALDVAVILQPTAGGQVTLYIDYTMDAGTTSSTTFKIRAGAASGTTTTFNGTGGSRRYGGASVSSIKITEYTP